MYQNLLVLNKPSSLFQHGPQRSFYAVFDGHGGPEAAIYASTHLIMQVRIKKLLVLALNKEVVSQQRGILYSSMVCFATIFII